MLAEVVKGPDLTATGRVVSTGNASLVLRTDDHGQLIPFVVGTTTEMPSGLPVGTRVTVHYHPIGTTNQMADRVVLVQTNLASAQAPATPSPGAPEEPAGTRLPRTASPLPFVGLLGLAALAGSILVRALERRHSQPGAP